MRNRYAMLACLVCLLAPFFGGPALAQDTSPEVVSITSPMVAFIGTRDRALENSIQTMKQSEAVLADFATFVTHLVKGETDQALALQDKVQYKLYEAPFGGKTYRIAMDASYQGLGPTLVLHPAPERELILEAPHASFELGSAEQGALLMDRLGARATLIAGAHRCASRTFTTCDGQTGVCGTLQSYLDSDAAHAIASRFQMAHQVLAENFPDSVVISLHGKQVETKGPRTEVIMSNGTRKADPRAATAATQLRQALGQHMTRPGALISCNLPADQEIDYRPLCGTTNIQGRLINGDPDPCTDPPETASGLFIHFEQDWPKLIPFHTDWPTTSSNAYFNHLAEALAEVERIRPVAGSSAP